MWFSTLVYVTLAAAATLQPISPSSIEESASSVESNKILKGGSHFYIKTNIKFNVEKDGER